MAEAGVPPGGRGRFATTRWSLVLSAGRRTGAGSAEALASLCEIYWYPIYAFIRRQGYGADESADLTQAFFARVLEKQYFSSADPARGRFRAFLCASARHFLSNERDRARTLKRGGAHPIVSLEVETAEGRYRIEPRDEVTPETLFDRRWALLVLERALARLRDEHRSAGKAELFERLKGFLTGDRDDMPYADVARTLSMSEGAVRVAVHRLRRRFRDALTTEIAETVSDPAEVGPELDYLMKAVST
jgi:RNA polymerase sigma-70 factor (ECF subfamily)